MNLAKRYCLFPNDAVSCVCFLAARNMLSVSSSEMTLDGEGAAAWLAGSYNTAQIPSITTRW